LAWIFLKLRIGGGGFVYTVGAVLLVVIVRLLTFGRLPR
jgi:hypothetical protein